MKKRQRRERHRHHRNDGYSGRRVRINEHVDMASLEDVVRATARFTADFDDWPTLAPSIVPLFPRRRPMLPTGPPVSVYLPPGIMTGFGVDVGPAVMQVGEDALERWGISPAELVATALANLRRFSAASRPRDLVVESVDGVAIRGLQTGQGVASTILLLPDELARIFGADPQWFIAPMRDLLVSVRGEADPAFLEWLNEEFASLDPNALALDAFAFRDGEPRLEPLGREAAMA